MLGALTVGVDDTGHDVTFFGATSGKKMVWDQSADTLIVDGTLDVNGDATVLSGAGSGSLTVGRNANENMVIYVDDSNTTITGVQDSDSNASHSFILNRTFLGSGANNFIIQKDGTAQLTLDTSGNASILGNLTLGDGGDKTITGPLNNDLILNARPNGSDEGLKIQIGGTDKLSVLQDGGTTFAGNVTAGSNSLTAGSLDINGNADISGNLTGLDNVTSTNFIIGGHTINDVDITSEDSNADDHLMTSKAIVNLIADNENSFLTSVPNHSGNLITTGTVAAARVATLNQNTTGSSGSCTGNAATATDATNLNATDDRDMAPEDYGYANDFRVFFTSKEGLEDGTSTGSNWQDALYINSYTDASGGDANVLAFDKSTKAIYHYQADQAATNWGTAKQLAYTDSDVSGDTTGNAATATTLATARTIAGVSFNGSANISLNNNAITNGAGYTGDQSKDDINALAVTTVGTISEGEWRGARISTVYQLQRQTFDFKGYSTHDGTNYEIPQAMTDTNAPFEHNTSVGSAGTTAISVSLLLRAGGQVMPYAGTIKKMDRLGCW